MGYGQGYEAGGPLLTAPGTKLLAKNSAQKENYCRRQQHRNYRQNQIGLAGFRKPF
jgi:hypothetical protein